jgi:very-short-patch-repair endonuclease
LRKLLPKNLARELRQNETETEQIIWSWLRSRQLKGVKFRRQQPIGDYIVDFVSFNKRLIIEIDGGQHSETQIKEKDDNRTKWLESQGFKVIRFWNNDVKDNPEGVFIRITEYLEEDSPSP